jgi:hypothetical protein
MSKNGKSSKVAPPEPQVTNGTAVTAEDTSEQKPVDKKRLAALFDEYDDKDAAIEAAKQKVIEAMEARSDVVKNILEAANGHKKLKKNGREMFIMSRASKATGKETFFFRGHTEENDAFVVDD